MGKLSLVVGAGAGFLLGSRAGTEPYERFTAQVQRLMRQPRVRDGVDQAKQGAKDKAAAVASEVTNKATEVASEVANRVSASNTKHAGTAAASRNDPDIDMTAGPQGDLP